VLGVALLVLAGAQAASERVTLQMRAEDGSAARTETKVKIEGSMGGQKMTLEIEQVDKHTYKMDGGNVVVERVTESSTQKFDGETIDLGDAGKETSTFVLRPNGTLVRYTSSNQEEDPDNVSVRIFVATSVVLPPKEVAVGGKWTHDYRAEPTMGIRKSTAQMELLALEKRGEVDTAKIRMNFREDGRGALSSTVTSWVDRASGDVVYSEFTVNSIPFGPPGSGITANATGTSERLGGGPLQEQQASLEGSKKEKTIDEVVKEFEKIEGVFTLYRKTEGGRDTIYMEIPESRLGKYLMLQATASTGTASQIVAGDPISDMVLYFAQIQPEKVALVSPNLGYRADPSKPIAKAVERSFHDAYLEFFKVEARQKDRQSLLIDVSDLFRGDIAQVSRIFQGGPMMIPGMGGGGYNLDRTNTFISGLKMFPENMVVETTYNFTGGGGGPRMMDDFLSSGVDRRSIVLKVNYNMFMLPEEGYTPRRADARVGYFTSDYTDFTRDSDQNLTVRNILRWRLEKEDPGAALSKPKKPIVFWLDKAIPTAYRPAVAEGILAWNKAFERVGFKDAIEVKQMPDDADFDHADMRYNVIRWVASPVGGYAVALFRANPVTGEILNASITVDSNMVRYVRGEADRLIDPTQYFEPKENAHSHHHHPGKACNFAHEAVTQARYGKFAGQFIAADRFDSDRYLHEFIAHVVAHEMGHILGLRHNFSASTQFTLDELADGDRVRAYNTAASVMEYTPFNIAAIRASNVPFYSPTVGKYDIWAIEYGYKDLGKSDPVAEIPLLRAIASRTNEPGLAYQSDETADRFDPLVTRFDLSRDPLEYWSRSMRMARHLLFNLDERSPKVGESYWEFTRDFNMLLSMYVQGAAISSRYVGGLHLNANFRGDKDERPTIAPVSADDQRRALELLNTYIFAENAFEFPRHYYQRFAPNPDANFMEAFLAGPQDFPVRDMFSNIQRSALRTIFRGDVLRRIANNEYKKGAAAPALTMPTLFRSVGDTVWAELGTGREVSPLRRQLQRSHLDLMIDMVIKGGVTDDARMLAWEQLRTLNTRIEGAKGRTKDEYTPVHLAESQMRIQRALAAQQTIGGGGGGMPSLLEILLGGQQQKPAGAGTGR
jgi:hypothetical protein